jgi:hypothetical protein
VDGSNWEPTKPSVTRKKVVTEGGSKEGESAGESSGSSFVMVEDPTAEEKRKLEEWKEELRAWKQGEAIVKQQIAATIPDSLFMKIRDKGTAYEIWQALTKDFQNKSRMVSVDLRRRLQQQRCGEKGDVRAHFGTLRTMREDLAAMGHAPSDDDFYAIVIGSLPPSYDPFISALNATSSVLGTFLTPDDLMQTITDEYDRRTLGKTIKKEENVAFQASDEGGSGEKGKGRKSDLKCFNCGKRGHKKVDCWAEGGGKAGQGPKRKGQSRGDEKGQSGGSGGKGKEKRGGKEAAASAKEPEVAWMAFTAFPDDDDDTALIADSCPDLEQLFSDEESDLGENEVSDDWEC